LKNVFFVNTKIRPNLEVSNPEEDGEKGRDVKQIGLAPKAPRLAGNGSPKSSCFLKKMGVIIEKEHVQNLRP